MHSLLSKAGLPAVGIFSELGADERAALMAELETRALKRGDVLVRQGDPADALYIVISGRFAVTLDGRRDVLTEIGPEQPIGEIAFLTGGTRTATVSAMRDSLVLRLGRAEFERISAKCPGIWRTLTTALSQRLAATTASEPAPPDPRPRTIAIIRAGGAQIPEEFIDQLASVFSANANTLVLDAARAADLLPGGVQLDSADATQALNQLESSYDYLLFIADAGADAVVAKGDPSRRSRIVGSDGRRRSGTQSARAARRCVRQHRGAAPGRRARAARVDLGDSTLAPPPQPRHAPPRGARTTAARSRASTASSTAPRSASSPAAAARSARPTSDFTRR